MEHIASDPVRANEVLQRTLEPAIAFANIDVKNHIAKLWENGTHKLSWSTLPWAAEGIAQILLTPEQTANKVVPIHGFEASQNDIISALEKLQNVSYEISHFDSKKGIEEAQSSWRENKDIQSALFLVKAGFFTAGNGSNFVKEGTVQVGNEFLNLPPLDFDEIVEKAVNQWA